MSLQSWKKKKRSPFFPHPIVISSSPHLSSPLLTSRCSHLKTSGVSFAIHLLVPKNMLMLLCVDSFHFGIMLSLWKNKIYSPTCTCENGREDCTQDCCDRCQTVTAAEESGLISGCREDGRGFAAPEKRAGVAGWNVTRRTHQGQGKSCSTNLVFFWSQARVTRYQERGWGMSSDTKRSSC